MKLNYETPTLEEVMIIGNVITESVGTLIPDDEIIGGEEVDW
jgi:hypothetical protein